MAQDHTTQTQTTDGPGLNLPKNEAVGASAGLVVGLALAWVAYGAALASAPVAMATFAISLFTIIVGQRLAALTFDKWLVFSLFMLAITLAPVLVA